MIGILLGRNWKMPRLKSRCWRGLPAIISTSLRAAHWIWNSTHSIAEWQIWSRPSRQKTAAEINHFYPQVFCFNCSKRRAPPPI